MTLRSIGYWMLSLALSLTFFTSGCEKAEPPAGTSKEGNPQASVPAQPKALLVPKTQLVDWCREHGVPESQCTRCNPALVDGFKKKADWCGEHGLPKSQCIACDPGLEAKLKAMAPKADATK
jgi:hypothetical protein